jgi:hypothetical protein
MSIAEDFQKAIAVEGASASLARSLDPNVLIEKGKGFNNGVVFYHFSDQSNIAIRVAGKQK